MAQGSRSRIIISGGTLHSIHLFIITRMLLFTIKMKEAEEENKVHDDDEEEDAAGRGSL